MYRCITYTAKDNACKNFDLTQKEEMVMEKTFFIKKSAGTDGQMIPTTDRFKRIEKLNLLVDSGWVIKGFKSNENEEYFLLEKAE